MATYTEITTLPEWENVLQKSKEKPVLLFKHSTTCPVSAAAYREFTSFESDVDAYLVKVIESRPVSNEIESNLGVQHQSPQIFILSNEEPIWHASHWNITETKIGQALQSI
ncbi:bacillithiol system redox-active protein YtxJ [Paenisporosarcina quisquiliarum]|uniref:Bacillithiol system redox-active protein YtxJ n=1 Tax=Paenisporosarcina quisquiliarum TaxID=365346 RepID=A0A9X3RF64_9BACL|nr:bacillithiol system redox-active protein YtxJ [Paenisporosarcina quisquiliarum]MCZ8538128.1 bacillithiol system redox-active protein YtxJ [Paenisporosarcina quisquiliarum]